MRAVIYARYSSALQSDASIEDQVRTCRARLEREGWALNGVYSDHAISGSIRLRPGYQKLLEDARKGEFDVVVAEALDRLSRDQEDVAALYKHLTFAGVTLITLSEGEISELHVGLKGTMNALFLKDLARKTWRGLEGRVRQGKSGGGLCYGYDVVQAVGIGGQVEAGGRQVNETEAGIVRRIFEAFSAGSSPRSIAIKFNVEGVPGPHKKPWGPSTIYGNWRRGTGILNNELYVGRLIWNRQRFIKDPRSGKRVARLNPPKEWVVQDVPTLRIVSSDLWEKVKARQRAMRVTIDADSTRNVRAERVRRPVYLLSGLLRCGACGNGFSMISANHYGCANARNRGTCINRLVIRRDKVEGEVLQGLKGHLMQPALVEEFIEEYHRSLNARAAANDHVRQTHERELVQVRKELRSIIETLKRGIISPTVQEELEQLEVRQAELVASVKSAPPSSIRLHPNLAGVYRQKVENLREALNTEETRGEAVELLRSLIDEIRLVPEDGQLRIHLVGKLAALLALGQNKQPVLDEDGLQLTLVAGARSHLYRTHMTLPRRPP